jgi:hypothetical protein
MLCISGVISDRWLVSTMFDDGCFGFDVGHCFRGLSLFSLLDFLRVLRPDKLERRLGRLERRFFDGDRTSVPSSSLPLDSKASTAAFRLLTILLHIPFNTSDADAFPAG